MNAPVLARAGAGILLLALLAGCSVGPDYHRPVMADIPTDWHWRKANPSDDAPKGKWWTIFHDSHLNELEDQALAQNTDVQQAVARVDSARAQARLKGADFFPTLTAAPAYTRTQEPLDQPQFSKIPIPGILNRYEPYNSFSVPLDLSYEVDIWGKVRRTFEAAHAQAQASVADFQNVLLTLEADVAVDYFTLREYDEETRILIATAAARKAAVDVNQTRIKAGRATEEDLDQAQTDYTNAQADLAQVQRSRAETQDALAVLCGTMPTNFNQPANPLGEEAPPVPVGLPASVLERRPDIAEAERQMAAYNAQIGVAYAAFFPSVTLTGQGGYLSARASDLFQWQNSIWSFGPAINFPIFEGGRNLAQLKSAHADYDQSVARYRGTVLNAFRDVEDSLADLRFIRQQRAALDQSVNSSRRATELARRRFIVGQSNYTDVIVAEETQLTAERAQSQARGQALYASVRLIKAMGGGWDSDSLKSESPAPYPVYPLTSEAEFAPPEPAPKSQ
jgi:multidrug efflux system outer membrane protein